MGDEVSETNATIARLQGWETAHEHIIGGEVTVWLRGGRRYVAEPPDYLHSIALAWELVAALYSEGWRVNIGGTKNGKWRCSFWEATSANLGDKGAWADSVEAAICGAYLEVKRDAANNP